MKNKNMFNKLFLILTLLLTSLTACSKPVKTNSLEVRRINSDKLIELINEKSGERFLYIGRESCKWCKDFEAGIKEVKTNKIVYYFDADKASEEELKEAKKAIGSLDLDINSVPALIRLSKNEKSKFKISNNVEDIEKFLNEKNR